MAIIRYLDIVAVCTRLVVRSFQYSMVVFVCLALNTLRISNDFTINMCLEREQECCVFCLFQRGHCECLLLIAMIIVVVAAAAAAIVFFHSRCSISFHFILPDIIHKVLGIANERVDSYKRLFI